MTVFFIITLITSIIMEYEFWASSGLMNFLPFFQMIKYPNIIVGTIQAVALKWAFPFGIFGIIYSIVCLWKCRDKEDEQFRNLTLMIMIINCLITFCCVL